MAQQQYFDIVRPGVTEQHKWDVPLTDPTISIPGTAGVVYLVAGEFLFADPANPGKFVRPTTLVAQTTKGLPVWYDFGQLDVRMAAGLAQLTGQKMPMVPAILGAGDLICETDIYSRNPSMADPLVTWAVGDLFCIGLINAPIGGNTETHEGRSGLIRYDAAGAAIQQGMVRGQVLEVLSSGRLSIRLYA